MMAVATFTPCPECGISSALGICPNCGAAKFVTYTDTTPIADNSYVYCELLAIRAELAALRGDVARVMHELGLKYREHE